MSAKLEWRRIRTELVYEFDEIKADVDTRRRSSAAAPGPAVVSTVSHSVDIVLPEGDAEHSEVVLCRVEGRFGIRFHTPETCATHVDRFWLRINAPPELPRHPGTCICTGGYDGTPLSGRPERQPIDVSWRAPLQDNRLILTVRLLGCRPHESLTLWGMFDVHVEHWALVEADDE